MRKIIRILAIIYLVYLGLVLLVVTPALYFLPAKYVKDYLGRDLHADFILFNPFTLSLEARNLALPDRDGSPFVSLDSASVNLSLASIWRPGIVFDRVAVLGLLVDIKQGPDGGFNFDDLIPPEDPDAPPAEPTEIPGITIDQLDFQARQLMFSSAARENPSAPSWIISPSTCRGCPPCWRKVSPTAWTPTARTAVQCTGRGRYPFPAAAARAPSGW